MTKTKVTYIISDIDKALAFEWVAIHLDKSKIHLEFILLNPGSSQLETFIMDNGIATRRITIKGKKSYISAFFQLLYHFLTKRPHAIHCHLRDAELLGITAARLSGIKKRIYTRHSSTYNHIYHPKGVKIDKFINKLSTSIIAISANVKKVLTDMENVPNDKIELIHHGFDLKIFEESGRTEIIRKKYGIPKGKLIIGIIARYTWWKGYKYSIPAIARFIKKNPETHLLIANANGNDAIAINDLITRLIPKEKVTQIQFEKDLPSLYKLFNVYVHVPFDPEVEAFGQTYVEALASGVPSIFTLSGIANEFIKDRYNALVVPFKNEDSIYDALVELTNSEELQNELMKNGKKSIQDFSLESFMQKLTHLYIN